MKEATGARESRQGASEQRQRGGGGGDYGRSHEASGLGENEAVVPKLHLQATSCGD